MSHPSRSGSSYCAAISAYLRRTPRMTRDDQAIVPQFQLVFVGLPVNQFYLSKPQFPCKTFPSSVSVLPSRSLPLRLSTRMELLLATPFSSRMPRESLDKALESDKSSSKREVDSEMAAASASDTGHERLRDQRSANVPFSARLLVIIQ